MKCERCEGCGKLIDAEGEGDFVPLTWITKLPFQSVGFLLATAKKKDCPDCSGSGQVPDQESEEKT